MSEDNVYRDAEIVWVKLRSCWWPGEVCSHQRQPEGLLKQTKRKPYCVVKFFQEESFEYVKNSKMIYPFNCSKKDEFIRKGHALLAKNKYMEQFPAAVSTAERLTRSVTRSSLFFNSRPDSIIKAVLTDSAPKSERTKNGRQCEIVDKILQTKPRATTDPSQSSDWSPTYKCSLCDFQSTRQNVMVLHRRSHGGSGTTHQRNIFINRSIISSSNAKGLEKSDIIEERNKASKQILNKIMTATPVIKEQDLPNVIENRSVTEIESDAIKRVQNRNLAKENVLKGNTERISMLFIRPPPKKQLNFINCKSENIQRSLLADWIDEDKDDEDENEKDYYNAKTTESVNIKTAADKSNHYGTISFPSTSASAEKLSNQESVNHKISLEVRELQKPTSKIRNIPKKDRRNIMFTDFIDSEDSSHAQTLRADKDLSKLKDSLAEIPILPAVIAELHIEQPLKISTSIKEIPTSKIYAKMRKEKAELNDENNYSPRFSGKVKLYDKKSNQHETLNKDVLEKMSDPNISTVTKEIIYEEKNITNKNSVVTSSALIKCDHLNLSADNFQNELITKVETVTDKIMVKLSAIEPGTENLSPVVKVSDIKQKTLQPCIIESESVDFIKLKKSLVIQAEEFSYKTEQSYDISKACISKEWRESTIEESSIQETTTEECTLREQITVKSNLIEPPFLLESNMEESILIESTAEKTSLKSSIEEPTIVELTSIKPSLLQPKTTDPSTLKTFAREAFTVEPSTAEPSKVEPSAIERSTAESHTLEISTDKATTIKSSTVAPSLVEPSAGKKYTAKLFTSAVHPSSFRVESLTVEPSTVGSTRDTSTVKLSAVVSSAIEPSTKEPSSVDQFALEKTTLEQSTVESSTIKPFPIVSLATEPSTSKLSIIVPSTEEQTSIEQPRVEKSIIKPFAVVSSATEQFTVEPSTIEPSTVETSTIEPSTVETSIIDPFTVQPFAELTTVEQPTVELSKIKPFTLVSSAIEPSIAEPSTGRTSMIEPFTVEPYKVNKNSLESFTLQSCTVKPSTVKPCTMKSSTADASTAQSYIIEASKVDTFTVKSSLTDLSFVKPSTLKPLTPEQIKETRETFDTIVGEINAAQPTILERNTTEPLTMDEFNAEIDPNKLVPIRVVATKLNITKTKTSVFKNEKCNENYIHPKLSKVIEETILDLNRLPTTEERKTTSTVLKYGPIIHNSEEPNQTKNIKNECISKLKSAAVHSIQDLYSTDNFVSSKNQSRKKISNIKSTNTTLKLNSLFSSNIDEEDKKLSHAKEKSGDKILEEKYSAAVNSGVNSSDETSKVNTFIQSKKNAVIKKESKNTLRSSSPRGCKRDIFENKDFFSKKKTTKTTAKKIKCTDNFFFKKKQAIDSSLTTESFTIDNSSSIKNNEEKVFKKIFTEKKHVDKLNLTKLAGEKDANACILAILKANSKSNESVTTDKSTCVADRCIETIRNTNKSDPITIPPQNVGNSGKCTESQSISMNLDTEDANLVSELNNSKPRSSFSKASLACFDFNEEEDILTSIANFKKTYVSPEKNYNFGTDNRPKTPEIQLEMRDKQLSEDIEFLLKTTSLPIDLPVPSSASVISRPCSTEVRGLPIKERGKRIFKSRNRFQVESCSSVSTTSTTEVKDVSSSLSTNDKTDTPSNKTIKIIGQTPDTKQEELVLEKLINLEAEKNVDAIQKIGVQITDDKIENSEEEIVERNAISAAEVNGNSNKQPLKASIQMPESSYMDIYSQSVCISNENTKKCTNNIISEGFNAEADNFENPTFSCENGEKDEPHSKFLQIVTKNFNKIKKSSEEAAKQQCYSLIDQNEKEAFNYVLKQDDPQIKYVDEIEHLDSESKLIDQKSNLIEHGSEENTEHVYNKEIPVDEVNKANDSNCDSPFEYELVTTEVSTIVDHISTEEQSLENTKDVFNEVSEEVVSCCDDGTFLNEMIIADVVESQSLVIENEMENSSVTLNYVETGSVINENPSNESHSFSINDMNAKLYANEVNDIHVSNVKDVRLQARVENRESSSDDSSSIISDAEAEFGSPTSMLEEERVLNRLVMGNETAAQNVEVKGHKILKKITRKLQNSLKENKLIIQSVQCDIEGSTSNDIVNELVYDADKYGTFEKECFVDSQSFFVKKEYVSNKQDGEKCIAKETDEQENNELIEKHREILSRNGNDIVNSNYENSDSSEEDEEEICSPPIEPLLDKETEAELIANFSSTTSLSKSEAGAQCDSESPIASDIQLDYSDKTKSKSKTKTTISKENFSKTEKSDLRPDLNERQKESYYTITQKSDTIIKLNKHKDKSKNDIVEKDWIETIVDIKKSELAGEELSAAEALLLIPNQPTNVLENSIDLIKKPMQSVDALDKVETARDFFVKEVLKEESVEYSEPTPSQDLELDTREDTPKELVLRKRRSHMKVTPRKRIINVTKLEEISEESLIETKVAKLTSTPQQSVSQLVKSIGNQDQIKKSCAEQYEDSFALKFLQQEQLIEEMDSVESVKINTDISDKPLTTSEKQTPEKVHITVDISNPLSSQIATILGTNRTTSTEVPIRSAYKKRKQSVEDDIPSFIIKRPCPKTVAEEEAADRETIAQIQNLCPQVEITRKPSKDDQSASISTSHQATAKPQIINQKILRAGNNQPLITVTAKGNKTDEGIFDISNMPIVLSNEKIVNEKVHLVITPTTNPQIIKQFQNQHQMQMSNTAASSSNLSGNATANVSKPGITVRRTSCVRTKRTPSRQQLPEQQATSAIQNFEPDNYQQQIVALQQSHQQDYVHQQLQHQQQMQEEQNQLQQKQQNQQLQVQSLNQFHQQVEQHQFQHHHQNQVQQQLQEEQNLLIQQHHQLLLQQQFQQQHIFHQHQLVDNEKISQSNVSEKQIGIDNRGNKYVIIRNPSNKVIMTSSPELCKVQTPRATAELCDPCSQRTQIQKKNSPLTVQTGTSSISPLPIMPPLPVTTPPPNILSITSTQTNQPQPYFKDQNITSPNIPLIPGATTKPKGRGRGRPPKNKAEIVLANKQTTNNNVKVNANGRRSSGRICEPPRQRTRSLAVTTSSEVHPTALSSTSTAVYSSNPQQTQSIDFIVNPQFTSTPVGSSPSIHTNNESYRTQTLGLSPQSRPTTAPEISIEASEVSGGGYAVPSLPVPGYPQTYLLCELIGNKYKEVFSKPLYLSPDRTRFLEVPDELVTEAHKRLSDSRREPNPNALKLVSDGTPHILQSRLIEINSDNLINLNENNGQQNELLMQKQQQLSVEDQASALLCLQEQLTQEQLVQERLVRNQIVQEQIVQEQFVEEQFVQEQFVQEQFVQEQFVPEHFVQEHFVQEQFVQEQFIPAQFDQEQFHLQPQQFSLQLARFETGEVIEDAERGQMMVVTTGTHNLILDDKSFFEFTGEKKNNFYNAEKDTYNLTPQVISSLLHHYALGHITAVPALNADIGDQQEVSIADVIQNADTSTNILEVALDESGLYSEEQFINTGQILQIETPEGMQLIGTATENADLIFHHMSKASTNETNVLLNQAPKMSAVEIPSDKSKRRFESKPSTPATLEDCLNVIGVPIQSPSVPASLELPASVTNPAIVAKTRTPTPGTITMNEIIATGLCHHPDISSLPSISSSDQELTYEFFQSNTEAHEDKDHVNDESVVTDMAEYAVVTSSSSFDDPNR